MDMEYMDPFRRRYAAMTVQPFPGQQQAHQPTAQYPYWNPLMAYYQQQQRVALMGQGSMHLSKPAEPKPRLAKEEVELLEREFAKNQKPSSSTKRELAEQMGVEVPRINNWFQNRRAKEKQMKKTAEFEAQQARERAASEAKSTGDQDQSAAGELCDSSNRDQSPGDESPDEIDRAPPETKAAGQANEGSQQRAPACESPSSSDSDGFVHVKYEPGQSPAPGMAADLVTPVTMASAFGENPTQDGFHQPASFAFRYADGSDADALQHSTFDALTPRNGMATHDAGAFSPFSEQDFFATPSAPQFPSDMMAASAPVHAENPLLRHHASMESLAHSDAVSPNSMPDSPLTVANLRFKSPPPPADIAGRRKSRRPAPLGLLSLRGGPGPKTGVEMPRRADTVSPMRRISSATGSLCGRVQKTFLGPCGPRSPFTADRTKEALLQSLQENQAASMAVLNSAVSPINPEEMLTPGVAEGAVGAHTSDDEHGPTSHNPFASLAPMGAFPLYNNTEHMVRSPPGTPGLQMGTQDAYFQPSIDNGWNYAPQDEPLPTPSLCSHGGSELEFSMAPQLPGYVASQPVTPSFPPTMGPAYAGFFGAGLGQTEYHFPESYPAECSARSSPVAPPRSKQFQFAQNITPQDFSPDKP